MDSLDLDVIMNMGAVPQEIAEELVLEIYRLRAEIQRGCSHVRPVIDRFIDLYRIDKSGCWIWIGTRSASGYGKFSVGGIKQYAHRWSYEYHVGDIPEGLHIDHLCRVRECVNPEHLEPVTPKENYRRGQGITAENGRKKVCNYGHGFTPENTAVINGKRHCKECNRRRQREYQERKRKDA